MRAKPPFLFPVVMLTLLLSGCASTFDHRKEVAYRLLYQEDGFENDKAFLAAVTARFPPGSAVAELQRFAAANGGNCSAKGPDGLVCEIATRGQYCAAQLIRLEATVEGDTIKSVGFVSGGLGC